MVGSTTEPALCDPRIRRRIAEGLQDEPQQIASRFSLLASRFSLLVAPLGAAGLTLACSADDAEALAFEDDEDDAETTPRVFPLQAPLDPMAAANKLQTENTGAAYVTECRNAGVPVPENVLGNGWQFISDPPVTTLFMEPDLTEARLWTFEDGDGVCMALPRASAPPPSQATVVGVICMAWNGTTCYFTNAANTEFDQTASIPIGMLVGGADLEDAPEGPCSDCHAGENPFIIHPNDPAFIAARETVSSLFPDNWPTPIVPEAFPGNPEPLDQLGPVTNGQFMCDDCHRLGVAGRLPLVSSSYPEFCNLVLAPAIGQSPGIPNTMPPSGSGDLTDYADHVAWLSAACEVGQGGGVVVPFVPPSLVVRPPDVDPPYICAKSVRVSNAVYGATVKLYVDNVLKGTAVFRDPEGLVFTLASSFVPNNLISVSQTVGAITSSRTHVLVRDHTLDYPNGLPAPIISPTPVYECASSIAVLNVPGATLTVVKTPSGGVAKNYTHTSGYKHTWMSGLGSPAFATGTAFKVKQKLCTDESEYSPSTLAEDAPATLPELTLVPLVVGQPVLRIGSITQGSSVTLTETNSATQVYANPSVPYKAYNTDVTASLGAAGVQAGHHLRPIQGLCGVNSDDPALPSPLACNVATLVPEIATPHHGDRFVLVTYSVPGSNVRVFGAPLAEIGNGSGVAVDLSRALVAGEVIKVVASLPTCTVNSAFAIVVAQ